MTNWYKVARRKPDFPFAPCEKCGQDVPFDEKTCPGCGHKHDNYACPSCGERHDLALPYLPETEEEYNERMQKKYP